jgi:hypothetical protein
MMGKGFIEIAVSDFISSKLENAFGVEFNFNAKCHLHVMLEKTLGLMFLGRDLLELQSKFFPPNFCLVFWKKRNLSEQKKIGRKKNTLQRRLFVLNTNSNSTEVSRVVVKLEVTQHLLRFSYLPHLHSNKK